METIKKILNKAKNAGAIELDGYRIQLRKLILDSRDPLKSIKDFLDELFNNPFMQYPEDLGIDVLYGLKSADLHLIAFFNLYEDELLKSGNQMYVTLLAIAHLEDTEDRNRVIKKHMHHNDIAIRDAVLCALGYIEDYHQIEYIAHNDPCEPIREMAFGFLSELENDQRTQNGLD